MPNMSERIDRLRQEILEWQEKRKQTKQREDERQEEQQAGTGPREALEEKRDEKLRLEQERKRSLLTDAFAERTRERRSRAFASAQQEKVRLLPILSLQDGELALEMKLGRARMYIVRDMGELASRIAGRELVNYGKELTFSHNEAEVEDADVPLLRHILLLSGTAGRGSFGEFLLTGAALDETMRLLLGREVELRTQDGKLTPARVIEGSQALGAQFTRRKDGGAMLRFTLPQVAQGLAGAYFLNEGEGEVLCAFGESYQRIGGFLRLAKSCPRGIALEEAELDEVCARLLLPAGESVRIDKGQDIVLEHTPEKLDAQFLMDMDGNGRLICRVVFRYGDAEVPVPGTVMTAEPDGEVDGEEVKPIRRDVLAEADALDCVRRLFPEELRAGEFAFSGKDDEIYQMLVSKGQELQAHGEVFATERLTKMNVQKRRTMSFGLSPSGEKLLLRADLGGFTQEELDAAYYAYRRKKRYVRLESGAFLSGEALDQAAQAAQVLDAMDATQQEAAQGVEVDKARAVYLDEALKGREQMRLAVPKEATDFIERLKSAQETRAQQPATLNAQLRPYQLDGLSWLCAISDGGFGGLLADDMGLGKTIQAISLLLREAERGETVRALVVCPASLQLNWLREAEKFAPGLRASGMLGGAKERERILGEEGINLLVTSYDQVRRDAPLYEGKQFSHIFLDEAQQIKNADSQAAKAVKTLRAAHRFAMTGTPVENRLSELWSIFDFLMPGYLLSYKRFRDRFESPIVKDNDERVLKNLRLMIAPFVLRRLKRDVLTDLPEKVEMVMTSEMTQEQRKQYAAAAARLTGDADKNLLSSQGRMRILAELTHMRQLCCDPRLCLEGYTGGSGKLDQCVELAVAAAAAGHRMLLFSQFTSMLALIREAMEEAGLSTLTLTGDTDKEERQRLVDAFNAGEGQVFLISLKAGGTGLNLTGADTVIHYDPWWNTAAQNQATDRAYRIGQTRGVQVLRLIAADSIEERILRLQEEKHALGEGVLEEGEGLATLDADALKKLIRGW